MRFGSVDMLIELGDWSFRMGRPIANEGFLKALLTYGTYDTYKFFCPDRYHQQEFTNRVRGLITDDYLLSRVRSSLQVALAEALHSETFDVFHLGDFTHFMPYLIAIRNRCASSPFPITGVTHSLDAVYLNLRYLELTLNHLLPFDGIICTSLTAKQTVEKGLAMISGQLRSRYGIDLAVRPRLKKIPLGIEITFFENIDKDAARDFFNIPADTIVALSVGRFSLRQKADWSPIFELLARMHMNKEIENLILIIAGGAAKRDISLLESLIARLGLQNRVLLFPNFPPEAKVKLYRAADFFLSIVDNFQETFGQSVVEAMATGLPVVVSDFSGYRELVVNDETGFLIPTLWSNALPEFLADNLGILDPSLTKLYLGQMVAADLDRLHEAIMALYGNEPLRIKMGLSARQHARVYHWREIIQDYETFWAELSQEARATQRDSLPQSSDILVGAPQYGLSHYTSKLIDDSQTVTLTAVGEELLANPDRLIRYEDVQVCLFLEIESLILTALVHEDQSIKSIKKTLKRQHGASPGQTEFHLLWLLKHGALQLRQA